MTRGELPRKTGVKARRPAYTEKFTAAWCPANSQPQCEEPGYPKMAIAYFPGSRVSINAFRSDVCLAGGGIIRTGRLDQLAQSAESKGKRTASTCWGSSIASKACTARVAWSLLLQAFAWAAAELTDISRALSSRAR